jgi:uncharacterized membrane protein YbhN (UPF0104 family)
VWSAITETLTVIGHANVGFVVVAVAVDMLALVLMAFRWRLLLRSMGSGASLWETLLAYCAGVCVCNITPGRALAGDACRTALIRRPDGSPSLKAVGASVVYDRIADLPGFLLLAVIAMPLLAPSSPHWTMLVLFVLAAAVVARPLYRRVSALISRWLPNAIGQNMGGAIAAAVGCSLIIWLLDITRVVLVGRAFGARFVPSQAAAVSLVRLGSGLVPVPAGLGVVDGALVAAFIWLGLPASTATAIAIVERAIVYGWSTALGAVALLLRGGLGALRKARASD